MDPTTTRETSQPHHASTVDAATLGNIAVKCATSTHPSPNIVINGGTVTINFNNNYSPNATTVEAASNDSNDRLPQPQVSNRDGMIENISFTEPNEIAAVLSDQADNLAKLSQQLVQLVDKNIATCPAAQSEEPSNDKSSSVGDTSSHVGSSGSPTETGETPRGPVWDWVGPSPSVYRVLGREVEKTKDSAQDAFSWKETNLPSLRLRKCRLCRSDFTDKSNVGRPDGSAPCSYHPGELEASADGLVWSCCGGGPITIDGLPVLNLCSPGCEAVYHQDKNDAWDSLNLTMKGPRLFLGTSEVSGNNVG